MIAWNKENGLRDAAKKSPSLCEFAVPSTLGEIAAKGDEVRAVLIDAREETLSHIAAMVPEMQIGDLSDGAQ